MIKIEKLSTEQKIDLMFDLINSFRNVKGPMEIALFLQDLLTANDIRNLSTRLRIAKLLLSGITQREICSQVHTSLATVSKVNIWLEEGVEGFKKAISKLPVRYKMPEKLPKGPIEFHLPQTLLALGEYALFKKQNNWLKDLNRGVKNKKNLDKSIHEIYSESYRFKRKHA